ncbi:MAG: hypothetical protein ACRDRT_16885 [Pseudonocardiaceae bacterium]
MQSDDSNPSAADPALGDLYRGFSNALFSAFEFALTPTIFGGIGYLLGRWLGLVSVLTVGFFLLGVIGVFARMWYGYAADMKAHEAQGPWAGSKPVKSFHG